MARAPKDKKAKKVLVKKRASAKAEPAKAPAAGGEVGHPLASLKGDIDRAFEDAFRGWPRFGRLLSDWDPFKEMEPLFGNLPSLKVPSTDIKEADKKYSINMELAGVAPEDVEISLSENMLTVKGEKKSESSSDEEDYHLTERSYGRFERSFRLPDNVNVDKIDASCKDGVLKLTLPKQAKAKSGTRNIKVKSQK
jgi:HSP20 family protein